MTNIEKSTFKPGTYIGYANGVWEIRKSKSSFGNWVAIKQDDPRTPALYASRLSEMSEKLKDHSAIIAKT